MNALVTGGGGFLGQVIVRQLVARGDRVRSFGRGAYPELASFGVEVVRGDICNAAAVDAACRDVDCVFHAAALAGVGLHFGECDAVNRGGTENVLAACRRQGVGRLVHTSSPSVTFAGEDQRGVDERAPQALEWLKRYRAWYSYTKALAERVVLADDAKGGSGDGALRTCALRPHLIWGPGDNHLIPRVIARARAGRLRRVGDGTNLVDICYVDNAAAAHLAAADALALPNSPVAGKAYYLSQGAPVNCWKWIDEILALAGLPPVTKSVSLGAAWAAGTVCEAAWRLLPLGGEPPMTRFLAAQFAKSHWFDISAARRDFGYEPAVSTAEGMRRLGDWLRTLA
jgi:2-alkyl-3-oxoalkanoate reductase